MLPETLSLVLRFISSQEGEVRRRWIASLDVDFGRGKHWKTSESMVKSSEEETGVPLSNLVSYITVNYVREEKKKRANTNESD